MSTPTDPRRTSARSAGVGPALQQRSWAALMLALISLFGLLLMSGNVRRGIFVVVVALLIGATGLGLALSVLSRARRAGVRRPRGAVLAAVLGVICCLFSVLVLTGFALFWPQLTKYSQCLAAANTVTAQNACTRQLDNSLGSGASFLRG